MNDAIRSRTVTLRDSGIDLQPDPGRTLVRFFVPGNEDVGPGDSRAGPLLERILDLDESTIERALRDIDDRFGDRIPELTQTFAKHASLAGHRLDPDRALSESRLRLLGAAFTHEYAIEGAALCNPSIVRVHTSADGTTTDFALSVRGIGEGHRSSIGFRSGSIDRRGQVTLDAGSRTPIVGAIGPGRHHRDVVHDRLAAVDDDHENAAYVLDALPPTFDDDQLEARLAALTADAATRRHTDATVEHLRAAAAASYRVTFPATSGLSDRVLWPHSRPEQHGMEDARFVEITDAGAPRYCATYTAFDGQVVQQHLITSEDLTTFEISPMAGPAAQGKGLALFPRRIGGRYVALSRADRETNSIATSDDLRCWDRARPLQEPRHTWEILQLGNCGSPIETAEGWLVLTHGVGPMRTYSIGAILLDLEQPERVIAATRHPVVEPHRHDGYVPNVVYSCGALLVGDDLVVPLGVGDRSIRIVTIDLPELLGAMHPPER